MPSMHLGCSSYFGSKNRAAFENIVPNSGAVAVMAADNAKKGRVTAGHAKLPEVGLGTEPSICDQF